MIKESGPNLKSLSCWIPSLKKLIISVKVVQNDKNDGILY